MYNGRGCGAHLCLRNRLVPLVESGRESACFPHGRDSPRGCPSALAFTDERVPTRVLAAWGVECTLAVIGTGGPVK
eukprot:5870587-Pyramimonas_sp.AAC.1